MQLTKVLVKNFASYYDEIEFDLDVSSNKPIVVFVGETGYGKSSLFDAINWILYGEDYEKQLPEIRNGRTIEDFVHSRAIKEAVESNDEVEISGTLWFEHSGSKYSLKRSLVGSCVSNNGKPEIESSNSIVELSETNKEGDTKLIEAVPTFLDDILPSNVRNYFLFDGDRINNLADPKSNQDVRDAIRKVVDLEVVTNSIEHLERLSEEYAKTARKKSKGELAELNENLTDAKKENEKLKKKQTDENSEKRSIEKQLSIIEAKLDKAPESSKIQEQKKNTVEKIDELVDSNLTLKLKLKEILPVAAISIVSKEIESLYKDIDLKRQRGDIPKHISETLINDLLEIGKCICDSELDDKMRKILRDRLSQEKGKSRQEHELLEVFYRLQELPDTVDARKTEVDSIEEKINTNDEAISDWRKKLQELERKLDELPQENIEELRTKQKTLQKDLDDVKDTIRELKGKIKDSNDKIKSLKKERTEKGKEQKEAKIFEQKSELAEQSAIALKELYDDFAEESRAEVERLTRKEFNGFVESARGYTINITKDFDFEALDENGNQALQRFSMGQKQCLSLSFILAISKVSQKNPPIVYDMPFGRLSEKVNTELTRRLPNLASQLILFLIPGTEWNPSTQSYLKQHCSHVHVLTLNSEKMMTDKL